MNLKPHHPQVISSWLNLEHPDLHGGQDVGRAPQQWGPSAGPPGGGLLRPSAAAERRLHRAGAGGGDPRRWSARPRGPRGPTRRPLEMVDVFYMFFTLFSIDVFEGAALWPMARLPLSFSPLSLSKLRTTNLSKSWKGWATEKRCGSDGKSNVRKHWFSPLTYGNPHSDILAFRHVLIVLFLFKSHSRISGDDDFNGFRIPTLNILFWASNCQPGICSHCWMRWKAMAYPQTHTSRLCLQQCEKKGPAHAACEPSGCTKSWVSIWIPKLWCLMVASEQVKTRLLPPDTSVRTIPRAMKNTQLLRGPTQLTVLPTSQSH